jgi:hypothetical protein
VRVTSGSIAFILAVGLVGRAAAQSALEIQAGLGYARAFDGGGPSFAAALERPLSRQTSKLQHALGGSFWYSQLSIGSRPSSSVQRHMTGVGVRYQVELRAGRAHPFLAVPLQVLRSSIPTEPTLQAANASISRVPNPGPVLPVEDRIGSEWGWGTGIEMGLRLGLSSQLTAQTSVLGLYHRIYEAGNRNSAWTIQGGISYQLGR